MSLDPNRAIGMLPRRKSPADLSFGHLCGIFAASSGVIYRRKCSNGDAGIPFAQAGTTNNLRVLQVGRKLESRCSAVNEMPVN